MTKEINTDICIVGGGPAGMLLALLLAKQGIEVHVLEQNQDFEREYRGEVTQPRFMQVMKQINLLQYLESYTHIKIPEVVVFHDSKEIMRTEFSSLTDDDSYCTRLPQPVLLEALLRKAQTYPGFNMMFNTKVRELLRDGDKVTGVYAQISKSEDGADQDTVEEVNINAKLTVAVDGRFSTVVKLAGLEYEVDYHEHDLLWFTFKKPEHWEHNIYHFYFQKHYNYLFLPKFDNHIQCGISLDKGEYQKIRNGSIEEFKQKIVEDMPVTKEYFDTVHDFKDFVLLLTKMKYLKEWAIDGCVVIGDAAHCVTPWGAVGSTLAMETAIVAADVIYKGYKNNDLSLKVLKEIQNRRHKQVKMIHNKQLLLEKFLDRDPLKKELAPLMFNIANKIPDVVDFKKKLFTASLDEPLDIDESFIFENE